MQYLPPTQFIQYYKALKQKVWKRDNYVCQYCGLDMKELYEKWRRGEISRRDALITVDHIKPKRPNEPYRETTEKNLLTACWRCNQKKGGYKNAKNKGFMT